MLRLWFCQPQGLIGLSAPSLFLVAIVAAMPIQDFVQDISVFPFLMLLAAFTLLLAAWTCPAEELNRAGRAISSIWLILVAPPAWMLFQLVPLPLSTLTHPIWINATAALDGVSAGHVTMSMSATSQALAAFIGAGSLALAAAIVFADRRRAEIGLAALIIGTGAVAGLYLGLSMTGAGDKQAHGAAVGTLGCILSVAGVRDVIARKGRHRPGSNADLQGAAWIAACAVVSLAFCVTAVVVLSSTAWIAAMAGVLTLVTVMFAHGTEFRGAHHLIVLLIILAATVALAAKYSHITSEVSFLVELASAPSDSKSTADRIASDSGWLGVGAGAYADAARAYQELGQPLQGTAPSTAVKLAVEWGIVALLAATLAALWLLASLVKCTMQRGRDAFYSAASAGCIIALAVEALLDASLVNPTVSSFAAVILGLGLGQAYGRSTQISS